MATVETPPIVQPEAAPAAEREAPRPRSRAHGFARTLHEVWTHRELLWTLTVRDLRVRYKSSALGLVWSMLNPLVLMVVYWGLFTIFFPNGLVDRFPVYMLLGLLAWNYFAMSLMSSSVSLIANAAIVSRVAFPRQIVPVATVFNSFINMAIGMLLVIPFLVVTGSAPNLWTLQFIPVLVLFTAFIGGLSLLVAAGTVFFRDIEHLLGTLLFPLFFATPILWEATSLGLTGLKAKILFFGNPVTPYVSGFRTAFYEPAFLGWGSWAFMTVVGTACLVLGVWVFSRAYDELPTEL